MKKTLKLLNGILRKADMGGNPEVILAKLQAAGLENSNNLEKLFLERLSKENSSKNVYKKLEKKKRSAWVLHGTKNKKIYAWYLEYCDKNENWLKIEDYRENNNYRTTPLKTALEENNEHLETMYKEVCSTWRQLVSVRFKLLGFLPIVSIAVILNIITSDMQLYGKLLVCCLGLIFTYGIRIYDKRNTELHDQLISRGRKIEEEWGIDNGIFIGRKISNNYYPPKPKWIKVQHDVGLKIIYGSCYLAWVFIIVYLVLK
ncbi:hypothetical protein [uncultured Kriegella sp.]|uniref:hypothetical protein n=1 Tax=uncultured Kriegella sp. TaxID=1798910 RepID=UPI0030D78675